jgi:hypothetical protein
MTTSEFVQAARSQSLRAPALFSKLPWLFARSLTEFLQLADVSPSSGDWSSRAVQESSTDFHRRAGTLTAEVAEQISRLHAGKVVRLSHQPNFFAYMKLIGQFVGLQRLSILTNLAPIYYFIDYDTVFDARFNRSYVPDPTHPTGSTKLQLPRSLRSHRTATAGLVGIPSKDWLTDTKVTIEKVALKFEQLGMTDGSIENRLSRIITDLDISWSQASNIAEMNAMLLSRYINLWMGVPIPFISGSFLWNQISSTSLKGVLENRENLELALNWARSELTRYGIEVKVPDDTRTSLPWWHICKCGSRMHLILESESVATGTCTHCNNVVQLNLSEDYWTQHQSATIPKIILHNLLNRSGFGYVTGVNHLGSAEHVVTHSLAMSRLSQTPMAQWLWQCDGPFDTVLEDTSRPLVGGFQRQAIELVQEGNASFLYFALCKSTSELRLKIENKLNSAH